MRNEKDTRLKFLEETAIQMMGAARTAPKGRGKDNLEIALLSGDELKAVAAEMSKIGTERKLPNFERDAENVLAASFVVLIGTRISPIGLPVCGLCGFENCGKKPAGVPCQFNIVDLGIALGSAVALAADHRADNRIMYTIGLAAQRLKLFGPEIAVAYGIPLSCTGKSPFFDR